MFGSVEQFLNEHRSLSRRFFLSLGPAGIVAWRQSTFAQESPAQDERLRNAIGKLESWLTKPDDFQDVSRGDPLPHSLSDEKRAEVGLTRATWRLNLIADPEFRPRLGKELKEDDDSAFRFSDVMEIAQTHAIRFPKIMTCLNIGCPLGNGIWEGVPLREIVRLANPRSDLRRIFYYGYHNDDPEQMFRSSLPAGRVLEDYYGLPPVILCYKLNGQWLTPERGAPVRVVVPEAYGFKNIKWLSHVVLSNRWQANDTYGEQNNSVDSPMKTFCETLSCPAKVQPHTPFAVTGYAQVGVSGLKGVQAWLQNDDDPTRIRGPRFEQAPWRDAEVLSPPSEWGGGLPAGRIPNNTRGFDAEGHPRQWPLPFSKVHWAIFMPGQPPGEYTLRCRTIDSNGIAQPMPRPYRKSGRAAIQEVPIQIG